MNSEETLDALRSLDPELVFVVGWYQLVREPFIALAREGVFGMHPTLLPRHRGRASIPWAILSGLARTGVTLFEIVDESADSGAIVGQAWSRSGRTTRRRSSSSGSRAPTSSSSASSYRRSSRAPLPASRRIRRRASSWPRRRPPDGIIDWETRAPYLYDWVRAQTRPYPGAFTFAGDEKVVVWRARPVELDETRPPGRSSRADRRARSSRAATARSCSRRSRPGRELAVGTRLG